MHAVWKKRKENCPDQVELLVFLRNIVTEYGDRVDGKLGSLQPLLSIKLLVPESLLKWSLPIFSSCTISGDEHIIELAPAGSIIHRLGLQLWRRLRRWRWAGVVVLVRRCVVLMTCVCPSLSLCICEMHVWAYVCILWMCYARPDRVLPTSSHLFQNVTVPNLWLRTCVIKQWKMSWTR